MEARSAMLADTRAKIDAHGWTVIAVFPNTTNSGPPFAYTVGLSARGLPELAIYGLSGPVAQSLLNEVARRMLQAGAALRTGDEIEGVLVDDLAMVAVAMTDTEDLNVVRECYGTVSAAVQIVWPDGDGILPWEAGAQIDAAEQPVKGCPPDSRPVYHARSMAVASAQELAELVAHQPRQTTLVDEGMDPQRDNNVRAGWAAQALVAYAQHAGNSTLTDEVETAATDLLSDLRHLFDALGIGWGEALAAADRYYRAEILGQL